MFLLVWVVLAAHGPCAFLGHNTRVVNIATVSVYPQQVVLSRILGNTFSSPPPSSPNRIAQYPNHINDADALGCFKYANISNSEPFIDGDLVTVFWEVHHTGRSSESPPAIMDAPPPPRARSNVTPAACKSREGSPTVVFCMPQV